MTEMAATMLIDAKLPHYLWKEALLHAAYVRNRAPSRNDALTPHEKLFGLRPDASAWPAFGQTVVIHRSTAVRKKRWRFLGHGTEGAFVGFDEEVKGHHVYVPRPGPGIRLRTSADVRVLKTILHEVAVLPDDAVATPAEGKVKDYECDEDGEDEDNEGTNAPPALDGTSWTRPTVDNYKTSRPAEDLSACRPNALRRHSSAWRQSSACH